MSEPKDTTWGRAWRVLGPLSLILTGVGWLALGVALGTRARSHRAGQIGPPAMIARVRPAEPYGYAWTASADPRRAVWTVNPANGNRYRAVDVPTWHAGQAEAARRGAHLVAIDDATEQEWLVSAFGGVEPFWIGLTDAGTEGRWRWADGTPVSYTNWAADEPNNMYDQGEHYGVMNWRAPGKWNDMNEDSARMSNVRAAIIERPPDSARIGVGAIDGGPSTRADAGTEADTR